MTLREPITFVIITALIFAVSGLTFKSFWTVQQRDCHAKNAQLLLEQREGPRARCN